jgi:hypothetical protein
MVFKPETLLNRIRQVAGSLYRPFRRIQNSLGTACHHEVVRDVYAQLEPMNLSRIFLESLASEHGSGLTVIPVRGVHWSDWGSKDRIVAALLKAGFFDRFQKTWLRNQQPLSGALRPGERLSPQL